jgi:hypothetical protein
MRRTALPPPPAPPRDRPGGGRPIRAEHFFPRAQPGGAGETQNTMSPQEMRDTTVVAGPPGRCISNVIYLQASRGRGAGGGDAVGHCAAIGSAQRIGAVSGGGFLRLTWSRNSLLFLFVIATPRPNPILTKGGRGHAGAGQGSSPPTVLEKSDLAGRVARPLRACRAGSAERRPGRCCSKEIRVGSHTCHPTPQDQGREPGRAALRGGTRGTARRL